jgi:hypothetical protein
MLRAGEIDLDVQAIAAEVDPMVRGRVPHCRLEARKVTGDGQEEVVFLPVGRLHGDVSSLVGSIHLLDGRKAPGAQRENEQGQEDFSPHFTTPVRGPMRTRHRR